MAVATTLAIGAAVGGITSMVGAQVKKNEAKKQMEAEAAKANDAKTALEELEKNRQEVINPYENMANEFENLGVATQASKFQAEEADIALANTLDTIMQTGGGSGGATALARAALESKRGISADIQKQEKANNDARAEGANQVQQLEQFNAENREMMARNAKMAANQEIIGAVGSMASSLTGSDMMLGKKGKLFG